MSSLTQEERETLFTSTRSLTALESSVEKIKTDAEKATAERIAQAIEAASAFGWAARIAREIGDQS